MSILGMRLVPVLVSQQRNLPEYAAGREPLVCFGSLGERVLRAHRNPQFRLFDSLVEALELLAAGNEVVEGHANVAPGSRERFQAVEIRSLAETVASQRINAVLEGVSAGEPQHGIRALRSKLLGGCGDVSGLAVHNRIRSQPGSESQALVAGCRREHLRAAHLGELDCEGTNRSAGTVDDERLAALQLQDIVDALESGESAD